MGAWSTAKREGAKEKGGKGAEWILQRIQLINEKEVDEVDKRKLSREAVSEFYKSTREDKQVKSDPPRDTLSDISEAEEDLEKLVVTGVVRQQQPQREDLQRCFSLRGVCRGRKGFLPGGFRRPLSQERGW